MLFLLGKWLPIAKFPVAGFRASSQTKQSHVALMLDLVGFRMALRSENFGSLTHFSEPSSTRYRSLLQVEHKTRGNRSSSASYSRYFLTKSFKTSLTRNILFVFPKHSRQIWFRFSSCVLAFGILTYVVGRKVTGKVSLDSNNKCCGTKKEPVNYILWQNWYNPAKVVRTYRNQKVRIELLGESFKTRSLFYLLW